jgi:LysM repeat protein
MRKIRYIPSILALAVAIAVTGLALAPVAPVIAQSPCGDTVTVQPGDTLWTIARICEVTLLDMVAANPTLTNPNLLFVGQVLRVPQPGETPSPPGQPDSFIHIVQPGEWLLQIARRYELSLSELLAANPLVITPNQIVPGQQLVIPRDPETLPELGPGAPEQPDSFIYTVQPGEWLLLIARRYDVSLSELLAANPQLTTPGRIFPGQRLLIPRAEPRPTASLSPSSGPLDSRLSISAQGFAVITEVEVALGPNPDDVTVIDTVETTAEGTVTLSPALPAEASPGETWYAVVRDPETGEVAVSNAFRVTEAGVFEHVLIYVVAVGDAGERGREFGCADSIIPWEVEIEPTVAPLTAALEYLLSLDDPTFEGTSLYNALAASDLEVESINIVDGTAIIELTGTVVSGGVCDDPRIEAQLSNTARQFATVDDVEITVNGTPLDEILSQQ